MLTLGPSGRNVIFQPTYSGSLTDFDLSELRISKDGATIAKSIDFENRLKNIGAKLIEDAATQANEKSGDGTTTSIAIANELYSLGVKAVESGINPVELRKGVQKGVEILVKELYQNAKIVQNEKELEAIAQISSNGDQEIVSTLMEVYKETKMEGTISIQQGEGLMKTEVEYLRGVTIESGYLSPYFAEDLNDKNPSIEFSHGAYICAVDDVVSEIQDVVRLLEFTKKTLKPVIILAHDFQSDPLSTLVINKLQNNLKVVAVKLPKGIGREVIEDLATFSGAEVVSPEKDMKLGKCDPVYILGKVNRCLIKKGKSIFMEGEGKDEALQARIEYLKNELESNILLGQMEKEELAARIATLSGTLAIIKVGAGSQIELEEKYERFEDALFACKAAKEDGFVIGGGCALLYSSGILDKVICENDEQQMGITVLKQVCQTPLKQIVLNQSGQNNGASVIERLKELDNHEMCFDARSQKFVHMRESQIIDPVRVVANSLIYGTGVASILLTAEAAVWNTKLTRLSQRDEIQL